MATGDRAALRAEVRALLGEATEGVFLDSELNAQLTRAQREVESDLLELDQSLLEATASSNIVAGTSEYALPAGVVRKVNLVELDEDGDGVFETKLDEFPIQDRVDHQAVDGLIVLVKKGFYLRADYIGIVPTPTASVTNGLRVWYQAQATDFGNDASVCSLPVFLHELVVLGCCKRAALKWDRAKFLSYAEMYAEQLAKIANSFTTRVRGPRYPSYVGND